MENSLYNSSIPEDLFSPHQTPSKKFDSIFSGLFSQPYPAVPPKIPISQKLFEFTIRPEVPFSVVCGYLALIIFLNKNQDGKNRMKGRWWKATLLLHNLLLAVYSGWTFMATGPATFQYFIKGYQTSGVEGLVHNFCDSSMAHWDSVLAPYTYIFYLSKFWEILDTLILVGKGKKASLLQEYHHAGAILTVWSGVRYESPATWLFIVFNSLVHTIMYTYYALSVAKIPVPGILKRSLTKIQITQFVLGGSLGALTLFLRLPGGLAETFEWEPLLVKNRHAAERLGRDFKEDRCLHTPGQRFTVMCGVGYLIPLTGLFVSFYLQSYQRKLGQKNRGLTEKSVTK